MEYWVVLAAAVFHAIWNGMVKTSGDKLLSLTMIRAVGFVLGLLVILNQPPIDASLIPYLVAAACIHFIYFYCLINAYKFGDFSQVYPISRGLAPLLVLFVSYVFLQETLSVTDLSGTLLISGGVLGLALLGRFDPKPLAFAIGTAICIAAYTIVSAAAVRASSSVWVYMGWLELLTGAGVMVWCLIRRKSLLKSYVAENWQNGMMAGVLSILGFWASMWAISRAPMAPVSALRETSIIFAVLIGVFFMRESFAKRRMLASLFVIGGIALLVMS